MKKQILLFLSLLILPLIFALSVNQPAIQSTGSSNFSVTYNYINNTNSSDFWDNLDTPTDILGSAITNDLGWITSAGTDSWVGNYTFYYNKTSTNSLFCFANGTNCVTSSDSWSTNYSNYYNKSQVFNNTAFNSTQMSNSGGYLNILVSWLTSLFYTESEIDTKIINNASYFSTYNSTYASNLDTNDTKTIQDNNASWLSTYNETYLNTYNSTYANKADYEFLQNNFNGSGNITSGNIYPQATLTYDIGSGANRWNILWVRNISSENIDNSGYIQSASYCNASGTCRDLSGWGMGVDMTLYYLKTEVDNNFTLYTPVTSLYSNLSNYVLSNGSRAMTGDLNLGGFNITNVGNLTANYICNSTNCYTIDQFLTTASSTDTWSLNYTFYYNKTQVDNNLSLYLLLTDQRYNETSVINANNASWSSTYNSSYVYTSDETWINKNSSNAFNFNESALDTKLLGNHWFFVTNLTTYGTVQGTLTNTQNYDDYDSISYNFTEVVVNGLEWYANTTNNVTTDVNKICIRYKSTNDNFDLSIYDDGGYYESYLNLAESSVYTWVCADIRDSTDHLIDNKIMVKISHTGSAIITHKLQIDALYVSSGYTPRIGNEVDPISWHRNPNGESGNFATTGNLTVGNINASYYCNSTNCYTIDSFLNQGTAGTNISNITYNFALSNNGTINGINTTWLDNVVGFLSFKLTQLETWFTGKLTDINNNINNNLTASKTYANSIVASNDTWRTNSSLYYNATMVNLVVNGNATGTDSWKTNYTFYYNSTQINNLVSSNDTWRTNYSSYYTGANVNSAIGSNLSLTLLANGSRAGTGNFNFGNKNLSGIDNISANSFNMGNNRMISNVTCVIITGSSAKLEIC